MTNMRDFNPRYLAYCEAQGNEPDKQLQIDADRFPAGKMVGFLCWCTQNPTETGWLDRYLDDRRGSVRIPELEPDLGGEG